MIGRFLRVPLAGPIAVAFAFACGGSDDDSTVAIVGDDAITVTQVVDYMQNTGYGANRAEVERAVDELVSMKLVTLRARDRHQLTPSESLRMSELEETALWNQYRTEVIHTGVTVDEERLREWYDENVSEEVSARHILIAASPSDPDSVRQAARVKAESLLQQVRSGADFAALAEEHSEDPGSAQRGGSLGYFGRGQMVGPFEEAAFGTPVGEVAPEVIETQFGYHVIKVEDRRTQSFEELREEIEDQLSLPERQQAEQAYLTGLMENSSIEFVEHNIDRFKEIVGDPTANGPTADERELPLVTFSGGQITLGEIWDLFEILPEANRRSIAQLDQPDMVRALSAIVQRRLIMSRIRDEDTVLDSLRQREFDERGDLLWAQFYLNDIVTTQSEVSDAEVREYYDEHKEFYRGQSYDEVREQIRTILIGQHQERLGDPEFQRTLVAAVADSQRARVSVERNEEKYDEVLNALRERLEDPEGTARG